MLKVSALLTFMILIVLFSGLPTRLSAQEQVDPPLQGENNIEVGGDSFDRKSLESKREKYAQLRTLIEQLAERLKNSAQATVEADGQSMESNGESPGAEQQPVLNEAVTTESHQTSNVTPLLNGDGLLSRQGLDEHHSAPESSVDTSIDRLGLASSLYATQQFAACLDVITEFDESTLKSYELRWAIYLKAGCLRELAYSDSTTGQRNENGRLNESQQLYRQLVADPESDWLGQLARWWLDEIRQSQQLRTRASEISLAVEQWEAEVDRMSGQASSERASQGR